MENPREGIVSDHDADQMRSGNGESRPSAFHIEIADYAMSRGRADTVDMLGDNEAAHGPHSGP